MTCKELIAKAEAAIQQMESYDFSNPTYAPHMQVLAGYAQSCTMLAKEKREQEDAPTWMQLESIDNALRHR